MSYRESVALCLALFIGVMALGACLGASIQQALNPPPRLLAIGCEGTVPTSILYANEEDHFPRCLAIVENN